MAYFEQFNYHVPGCKLKTKELLKKEHFGFIRKTIVMFYKAQYCNEERFAGAYIGHFYTKDYLLEGLQSTLWLL